MDWSERMNAAVAYMEDNLTGEIDYNEAASRAACSLYYFYRVFSAIYGLAPADYARRRKLTLAAAELSKSDARVIDIAVKYGYDSPNAFTRAFRRLHGITPQTARAPGVKLAACPRISCHIQLKGGDIMDYQIVEKPAFSLVGKGVMFGMSDGEFQDKGRSYWAKYVATEEFKTLCGLTQGKPGAVTGAYVMSAYLPNKKGSWDPVLNVLGTEARPDMNTGGYEVHKIPAAAYAEFYCPMKDSAKTNTQIYGEWFPSTGYEHDDKPDIAAFFAMPFLKDSYVRWWIPVVKKSW